MKSTLRERTTSRHKYHCIRVQTLLLLESRSIKDWTGVWLQERQTATQKQRQTWTNTGINSESTLAGVSGHMGSRSSRRLRSTFSCRNPDPERGAVWGGRCGRPPGSDGEGMRRSATLELCERQTWRKRIRAACVKGWGGG